MTTYPEMLDEKYGSIPERVERGVAWLDANAPEDWRSRVEPATLRMDNACLCVFGQTYQDEATHDHSDGFSYALDYHSPLPDQDPDETVYDYRGRRESARVHRREWTILHGFDAVTPFEYEDLTAEWRRRLEAS